MFGTIYKITNKENGKIYIGQTIRTLEKRWQFHTLSKGCKALHAAIQKYGKDSFEIKPIVHCNSYAELNAREIMCIKLFNSLAPNGYNLKEGGKSGSPNEEVRKKMSEARTGKKLSVETCRKMSMSRTGKGNSFFGRTHSIESLLKMGKQVMCLDNGTVYNSATEAANMLSLNRRAIVNHLQGRTKTSGGLTFKYVSNGGSFGET